jgi:hypothetical protein
MKFNQLALGLICALSLAACGGGGGGGNNPAPVPTATPAPSVSGDMLAYQPYRGWNYQGVIPTVGGATIGVVTATVYADPQSSSSLGPVDPLFLFIQQGTLVNALGGTKVAAIGVQSSTSGYTVGSFILLNGNGGIAASGGISPLVTLVPSTLRLGQTFTPYPGASATVTNVGYLTGSAACPTLVKGATVQYSFMGQSYGVSYVPGCGIVEYQGNHGEDLLLQSIGSYPQIGNLSIGRKQLGDLNLLDTMRSAAGMIVQGTKWSPFQR